MSRPNLNNEDLFGARRAGKTVAEIARIAGCSTSTVRYHLKHYDSQRFESHVRLYRFVKRKWRNDNTWPHFPSEAEKRRVHLYLFTDSDGVHRCFGSLRSANCYYESTRQAVTEMAESVLTRRAYE